LSKQHNVCFTVLARYMLLLCVCPSVRPSLRQASIVPKGDTENSGVENDKVENRGGVQGWKSREWKT